MELAKKHDITVLEDAAHAFGASYKGKKIGNIGHFTAFSLHEVKNCTSFGEGGIICTTIPEMKGYLKRARFFGADFTRKIPNWLYDVVAIPGKYGPFAAGYDLRHGGCGDLMGGKEGFRLQILIEHRHQRLV